MIVSKYSEIDGTMYVEASDYDKILYELKNSNEKLEKLESELFDVQKSADEYYNKCIDLTKQVAELESELESKVSEIERLKKRIGKLASIRVRCHESARDSFDLGNYGSLHIVTADELKTTKDNMQKINLNETIKVKLTPYGAEIYYKQFDELNKQRGREICKPHMPRIDKDGYTEFQLWHFMELYGEHIGMCKPNVIEPLYIVYCGNDKCHSDNTE